MTFGQNLHNQKHQSKYNSEIAKDRQAAKGKKSKLAQSLLDQAKTPPGPGSTTDED